MNRIAGGAAVALGLAALGLALAAGCSVNHRSGDFACQVQADCREGRSCIDGFCVLPDGVIADASRPPDALDCPPGCTSCNAAARACTIDCALNGGCSSVVTCPLGWSCNVMCSSQNACSSGLSCVGSTACTINCSGRQSCKSVTCGLGACNLNCSGADSCGGDIQCGSGACKVNCSGSNSCNGGLRCGTSCACDVSCRLGSCEKLMCTPGCDAPQPPGCLSTRPTCSTCR